jgi:hypothetical protein
MSIPEFFSSSPPFLRLGVFRQLHINFARSALFQSLPTHYAIRRALCPATAPRLGHFTDDAVRLTGMGLGLRHRPTARAYNPDHGFALVVI